MTLVLSLWHPQRVRSLFWENIDNADSRSLYPQRQQGVEGSVKLYSRRSCNRFSRCGTCRLCSGSQWWPARAAHPPGFSGPTERHSVNLDHTLTALAAASSASSPSWEVASRRSIAAVKAHPSESKGHMEVISVTRNGLFQTWDLNWSGQHLHERDVDVYAEISSAMQVDQAPEIRSQQDVHVLDFAIMEQKHTRGALSLLVLVALAGRELLDYSLLEVDLSETRGIISRAIPIRNFQQSQLPKEPMGTLLLPQPGHTAYVQFPEAIFVASLAQPEESPDAQLLADSWAIWRCHFKTPFTSAPISMSLFRALPWIKQAEKLSELRL